MKLKPFVSLSMALLVGTILGMLLTIGVSGYLDRRTTVFTARENIALAPGIVLPKGTELIHHSSMSEGFETLTLFLNVHTSELPNRFERRVENRAALVIPYWIR